MNLFLILILLILPAAHAELESVPVLVSGTREIRLDDKTLRRKVPLVRRRVKEPHEGRGLQVEGFRFSALIDYLKQKEFIRDETYVFFTCRDGYLGYLEIKDLLKGEALLALKVGNLRDGETLQDPFTTKDFDWRPAYIVWEKPQNVTRHVTIKSPYQVTKMTFGNLGNDDPKVLNPEFQFDKKNQSLTKYCLWCHQANNWGGTKGPSFEELLTRLPFNQVKQVLDMNRSELAQKRIPMPVFPGTLKEKEEIIASLSQLATRGKPKK